MKQIKKVNKRFSMFEVLVVLAVLSILASLIFSSVGYARDEASRTQCLNNLHQIQAVIEVYRKSAKKHYVFLQGASPCRVRASRPLVPSVALDAEISFG